MSLVAEPVEPLGTFTPDEPPKLRTDSLVDSVATLMALTLVQPIIGFLRGVLICRWLDPVELGQWDLAFGFLTLAAPVVVCGIPGSFGRYVEYCRQRGQLRRFVRLALIISTALVVSAVTTLALGSNWFAQLIFGESSAYQLVVLMAMSLAPLVAFGFVSELLTALRLYRAASSVTFFRSVAFTALVVVFVFGWRFSAASVIAAYAVASLASVGIALIWLRRAARAIVDRPLADGEPSVWARVFPFAMWIWATNAVTNLFEIVDRYMIIHFSGVPAEQALQEVGDYHSSRVVPLLVVVFSNMLATLLLPHFSHAWETGNKAEVGSQLRLTLKLYAYALSAGSAIVLLGAPLLFGMAFKDKFAGGLAVMPWTLVYCVWFGLVYIADTYLFCQEEARLCTLALLAGLALNVVLNLLLLPHFGLLGAVLATSAAKLMALLLALAFGRMLGLKLDLGTCATAVLPMAILLGPWTALAIYAAVPFAAIASRQLLSGDEKARIAEVYRNYWQKLMNHVSLLSRKAS